MEAFSARRQNAHVICVRSARHIVGDIKTRRRHRLTATLPRALGAMSVVPEGRQDAHAHMRQADRETDAETSPPWLPSSHRLKRR
jgi:hypothetical protein